jgi:hypothetical protein
VLRPDAEGTVRAAPPELGRSGAAASSGDRVSTSGPDGPTPADLARSLREAADRLMAGWTGALTGGPGRPALPGPLFPPAGLPAAQLQAVLDDLAARRAQIRALREALGLFDEQLATLEASLSPLMEWSKAWAGMERTFAELWGMRPPDKGR